MTDGGPRMLACTSAVDMRNRLDPPVGEEMGLFVSVLWVAETVSQEMTLWELGRRIREKLAGKIRRGDPFAVAPGGSLLLPAMERLPGKDRSRRIVKTAEAMMYNYKGSGVSNVGRLEMPEQIGALRVHSISLSGSLVSLGYFLAVVNTFNGALHVNYMCNEPLISRERSRTLAKTAASLLREALD